MFEPPSVLMFENVNIMSFGGHSYAIYAYIVDKNKRSSFKGPLNIQDIHNDIEKKRDEYAGEVAYFGRGSQCGNC